MDNVTLNFEFKIRLDAIKSKQWCEMSEMQKTKMRDWWAKIIYQTLDEIGPIGNINMTANGEHVKSYFELREERKGKENFARIPFQGGLK